MRNRHFTARTRFNPPFAIAIVWTLLLAVTGFAGEPPFGLEKRVAWTSSRLRGSPEPPLPYTVEKTFTNVTFKAPVYIADEPGTNRLLVVLAGGEEKRPSRILRIVDDPAVRETELFLEVPGRLIYSVSFHPGYLTNRFIFLFSNGPTGASQRTNRITRMSVDRNPPARPDPSTELTIIEWASAGHDGGDLAFGPDGMLYLTTGDGSTDSDTLNSGQTMDDLLGNVLRIDVDRPATGKAYSIPSDNPFVHTAGARPEIWAYGLRNPWRMSIDLKSGQVWVGSNGQDLWESVNLVRPGENYGWSVYEGSHPFYLGRKRGPTPLVPPTIEHSHAEFRSLTGGVVYRGRRWPDLDGAYIYGDYSTGRIWGMKHNGRRPIWHRELADTVLQIAAFRVDQRGDLLVVDHAGGIFRLVPPAKASTGTTRAAPFPKRLSETGLFTSVKRHQVAPGVIPYSVNAPAWMDGAEAERFVAVPDDASVGFEATRGWNFPDGSALLQTISLDRIPGVASSRLRVESRVLLRQQGEWAGYSYRWTDDQSDAVLVARDGADVQFPMRHGPEVNGRREYFQSSWRFPSRTECLVCHSRQANFVLGLIGQQLNGERDYGGVRDNQLRALDHIGLFKGKLPKSLDGVGRMANPYDDTAPLEARARSYLHVNCAPCHVEAGGGNSKMELEITRDRKRLSLISARPQHDTFGLTNAMIVAPGEPSRSVLIERLSRRGPGQMPPLVSRRVDERAVRLMRDWIASLTPDRTFVREWQFADLLPAVNAGLRGRNFSSGQTVFRDTGCIQCHRFAGGGGTVGPDLTGVGRRLATRELIESILEPSKIIPDDYLSYEIELTDGETMSGRIEREDNRHVWMRSLTAGSSSIEVDRKRIRRRDRSTLSPMPAGIVNTLSEAEVLDLIAYLLSDGNADDECFK